MNVKKLLLKSILCVLSVTTANNLNAATGSMNIAQTTVPDLTVSASGTGWSWTADTETLTLTDTYAGASIYINCNSTETVSIVYNGNITITSAEVDPIYCRGSLNIDGSNGTLTLKYEGDAPQYSAISAMQSLTINGGTINASSTGSTAEAGLMSTAIYVSRAFAIKGNANLTVTATGKNAFGIMTDSPNIEISTTETVTSTATGSAYAIRSNYNTIVNSGTVKLSNSDNPNNTIHMHKLNVNGGVVIYNNGTPPTLTGVSPASGTHNITATLSGSSLSDVIRVNVNGKDSKSANSISENQITFLTPSSIAGSSNIFIETKEGAVNLKDAFTYTNTSYRATVKTTGNTMNVIVDFFDVEENTAMEQPITNPTLEGFTFEGWFEDINCIKQLVFEEKIITNDCNIYARFMTGSSIDESSPDKKIRITTSPETINIESEKDMRSVELFDLNGKLIQSLQINDTKTAVDIAHLARGVYILNVLTIDGEKESKKITK